MFKYKVGERVTREKFGCGTIVKRENWHGHKNYHIMWDNHKCVVDSLNFEENLHLIIHKPEQTRKDSPVFSGVLSYFPDAMLEIARVSLAGSKQHNPDQPLHWDRTKSTDEDDAMIRHAIDRAMGKVFDTDGIRHRAKIAWRALAGLQKELEDDSKQI